MSPYRRTRSLRLRALLLSAATAVALVAAAGPTAAAPPPGSDFTLTLLFSSDGESQLLGVDADVDGDGEISAEEENAFGSVARYKTLADQLRKEAAQDTDGALLVSGGDNFLAGPEFSASTERGVPFFDSVALREIGFDLSVIGNHEFDFGPETLADFIAGFDGSVPFVNANLDFTESPELSRLVKDGTITSTHVVERGGERVGVIGLVTPELPSISSPGEVAVLDELAGITNGLAAELEADGVDKILLVSHLQDIDIELELVGELSGVDAVVAAGGGEILANEGDLLVPGDEAERGFPLVAQDSDGTDVPVATVPGDFRYVGRIVLGFDADGDLLGFDAERSGPVRVSGVGPDAVEPDAKLVETVQEPVAEHVAGLAETVVATSEVGLDGVRENVRTVETNLGDLLADALVWQATELADAEGVPAPQVGIQNGGGIRNDSVIPAGDVTELDTFDVAPFTNFVAVVPEVPRETLRQLLERGVAAAPEAAGAFMQVAGLSFTYDTSQTAQEVDENTAEILTPGARVQEVVLDDGTVIVTGGEVVDGPAVTVVTNDFSARGGDGYPFGDLEFTLLPATYQQALSTYLSDGLAGTVTAADYPEGGEGRITATG